MLPRSIWPAANRWRNATQSSKRLCYFKCSVTDGRSACMAWGQCVSSSQQVLLIASIIITLHNMYCHLIFVARRDLFKKGFLWIYFVGIFILTLKRIGLASTLDDVGIFSFQLYSSRVIVFISQHRLLSHTLNFLFLYQIRPVDARVMIPFYRGALLSRIVWHRMRCPQLLVTVGISTSVFLQGKIQI